MQSPKNRRAGRRGRGRATVKDTESVSIDWDTPAETDAPALVFSPLAWLKLQFLCHAGDTEVGGFGVARDPDHPLYVDDFYTVPQEAGWAHVDFDDAGVADYTEDRVGEGLKPHQFLRVWIHTHPGDSPHPSGLDEDTFKERFGDCDWAVMFILAKGGDVYARLKFTSATGLVGSMLVPVSVDWEQWNGQATKIRDEATRHIAGWQAEYDKNVQVHRWSRGSSYTYIRADTSQLVRGEPGYSRYAATNDRPAHRPISDKRVVDLEAEEDVEEVSVEEWLDEMGLDFEDIMTMRDEDLDYFGFTADDIECIHKGTRMKDMTDADFRAFRRAWEWWNEEMEEQEEANAEAAGFAEEEDADVDDVDADEAPRKRGRPKARRK